MATSRNKSLPLVPPSIEQLHQENLKLHKRNSFLEEIIEILYVQNQQYSTITHSRKAHEREQRVKVERLLKVSKDLSTTQSRNRETIKELEEDRRQQWSEFCSEKTAQTGDEVWSYLENVKDKIIDKQYEELMQEAQSEEVVIKMRQEDLQ